MRWLDELLAGRGNRRHPPWRYFVRGFLAVLQTDPTAAQAGAGTGGGGGAGAGQRQPLSQSLAMASIAATHGR